MYKVIYELDRQGVYESQWIKEIKHILNSCGLCNIWSDQAFPSKAWLKKCVSQKLKDQFCQTWSSAIWEGKKCINYRIFKENFSLETYLDLPFKYRTALTKFRCRNHKFPIETGAHKGIDRANRYCPHCKPKTIGDEFHYLLSCKKFSNERRTYLKPYFYRNPSSYKMCQLLNSTDKNTLYNLSKFTNILLNLVET
jgi:hypothetical protein